MANEYPRLLWNVGDLFYVFVQRSGGECNTLKSYFISYSAVAVLFFLIVCPMFVAFSKILRAEVGQRLLKTPCALITSKFGWTGNMQRIIASQTHSKTQDVQRE